MECKVTNDQISVNNLAFNGAVEDSIEFDYALPDYLSSIFKILKSKITPKILSKRISGDKLVIDGVSQISIIYVAEETQHVRSIIHKIPFTKTVTLNSECENPVIYSSAKCDYINCRVVNPKRIDIRGTISCKIKIIDQKSREIITDVEGMGAQSRKKLLTLCNDRKQSEKLFNIKEDITLGNGAYQIEDIVTTNSEVILTDYKIIPNKVIAKGEVILHILYKSNNDSGELLCENKKIPISQIMDISGIDENYNCFITFDVNDIKFDKRSDAENSNVICEIGINLCCLAMCSKNFQVIKDVYSTLYESNTESNIIKNERLNTLISQIKPLQFDVDLNMDRDNLNSIYDTFIEFSANKMEQVNGKLCFSGLLNLSVIATDKDNMPIVIDKSIDCNIETDIDYPKNNVNIDVNISLLNIKTDFSGNMMNLSVDFNINGCVCDVIEENIICNINIDQESRKQKEDNCSLIVYYADKNENVWDIAKYYNTNVSEILSANELENETIENRKMLLIPISE